VRLTKVHESEPPVMVVTVVAAASLFDASTNASSSSFPAVVENAPDAMFGPRSTNEINWQGHDPADLVNNLRGVDVWLYTATGANGPYDPAPNPGASGIELATHGSTISFVQRAQDQGVPVHLEDYVYGTHTWAYWARDLRQYLVPLMSTFAASAPPPSSVSYQSIDRTWTQWGWNVAVDRSAAQQFSALRGASSTGFTLQGSGTATVTTPAFYSPGSTHTVTTTGPLGGTTESAIADASGHLQLTVSLGPSLPTVAVVGVPALPPVTATVTIAA